MIQVLFVVIATIGLAAALGTILARNLVRAALYLIGFFFTVACVFVLLEAEFLAALQVLVYIGAVSILLMFGIMLTRNIQGDDPSHTASVRKLPGLLAGLCIFVVLAYGVSVQKGIGSQQSWSTTDARPKLDRGNGPGISRAYPGGQQHGQGRGPRADDAIHGRLRGGRSAADGRARGGNRDRTSRRRRSIAGGCFAANAPSRRRHPAARPIRIVVAASRSRRSTGSPLSKRKFHPK